MSAAALPWTLAGYAMLAVSFFGWGRFASLLLGTRASGRTDGAITIFLGWASSLLVLQILNFVFPVNSLVSIPLFAAGVLFAVPAIRKAPELLRATLSPRIVIAAVVFALVAIWTAARGLYPVENFDSGLYHLQTIRWTNTYAIVPGLGNLHFRLAFNQSFFTYAAALNAAWFGEHAGGAPNGFLFLVLLLQATQGVWRHSQPRQPGTESLPLTWTANLLVLPAILYLGLSSDGLTSPTPDLAATLLELSMFLIFVRGLGEWRSGGEAQHFSATILPLLAVTAITVKLSTIAFAGTLIAACVLYEIHPNYRDGKVLRRSALRLAPVAAIMIVWLLRGLILSGCPLYPATAGCMSVDWSIPRAKIANEANWIYSWAREPGVHWRLVLNNWNWMHGWIERESRDVIGFVFPLAASALLVLAATTMRRSGRRGEQDSSGYSDFLIFVPVVAGVVFWFFTAPDPRFGRALFWMMAMCSGLVLLETLRWRLDDARYRIAVAALVVALNAPFIAYSLFRSGPRITRVSFAGWQPVPQPQLRPTPTTSGLTILVPIHEQRCYNSPVPCTPYFNPDLELRVPGRLDQGFADRSSLRRSASPPLPGK